MCAMLQRFMLASPMIALVSICFGFSEITCATILGGQVTGGTSREHGGAFVRLTVPFDQSNPPNAVGRNTFQSFNLFAFDEGQNIELPADLEVDILGDGTGSGGKRGVLPQGLVVASHYVFFDPTRGSQVGTVSFDSPVVAILMRTKTLAASDFLINNGVDYLNPGSRGLVF
jgi:hypothetical protein